MLNISQKWALLIIDYQYDFVNNKGFLKIKNAIKLKPYLENLITIFKSKNAKVIASKDLHPINHKSFNIWPIHCIKNTIGSSLMIQEEKVDFIVKKGIDPEIESYSAFFDEKGKSNNLNEYLKKHNITHLYVVGLAISYCIKATIVDAMKLGYYVFFDPKGSIDINEKNN